MKIFASHWYSFNEERFGKGEIANEDAIMQFVSLVLVWSKVCRLCSDLVSDASA